ncbi:ankyrin repeat domain-containing protein [Acetobacteraceae bacterium ESL0709]|nr:ankyrin repeat domain-containing protein [Acetobacteraceae bacterium ESL0697]MDF7678887.1 ankyrin repeat domain-containing protein [Acetobacteraceae bacterium ESL0709]
MSEFSRFSGLWLCGRMLTFSGLIALPVFAQAESQGHVASLPTQKPALKEVTLSVEQWKDLYFTAAMDGLNSVLAAFLAQGFSPDAHDDEHHETLLGLAAAGSHLETVNFLLDHGASDCVAGHKAGRDLSGVAFGGNVEILERLIKAGCSLNAQSHEDGTTLLMMAAGFGRGEFVRALLDMGANPFLRDKKGRTAYNYALDDNHPDVAALLQVAEGQSVVRKKD